MKDVEKKLLDLEKVLGESVIVTLLVQNQKIFFIELNSKKANQLMQSDDDIDDSDTGFKKISGQNLIKIIKTPSYVG